MINSPFLNSFKNKTKEEFIIADLLCNHLKEGEKPTRTMLDVGAGNGTIARLIKKRIPEVVISGVEPYYNLNGTRKFFSKVIKEEIQDIKLKEHFDVVVLSHVLGHVPKNLRASTIQHLFDHTNQSLFIITNALVGKFQQLQHSIWDFIGDNSYSIDLYDLLHAVADKTNISIKKFSVSMSAENIDEFYNLISIFSPIELPASIPCELKNSLAHFQEEGRYTLNIPQFFITLNKTSVENPLSINSDVLRSHEVLWYSSVPNIPPHVNIPINLG